MSTAVVTGTSSGIGLATAVHLSRNGYRVYAGMRNLTRSQHLQACIDEHGLPVDIVEMDVTSSDSVARAFGLAREHGPVDVLVNNAGLGAASPLELVPEDEHRAIFETNYFGAIRCMQAVIAEMREQRAGAIVNITSVEGVLAIPNQIPYSASKWALECAGEALAHELASFGVRVISVEPGIIMTNIFDNAAPATRFDRESPYLQVMRRNGKMFSAGFNAATQPERVAETVLEAIRSPEYKLRWPVGADAFGMISGRARMTDEEWVAMGGDLDDEAYNKLFFDRFGITL